MGKTISVTFLSSYLYCARKLYLECVLRIVEPPKETLVLGGLRHEVYEYINNIEERIVKGIKERSSFEDVLEIYRKEYSELLMKTIGKYGRILSDLKLEPKEIFKKNWPLIVKEADKRANNVFSFMERTGLSGEELWAKLTPKLVSELNIMSENLGLKGRIDQVEVYDDIVVPIELKTGKSPNEGAWPSHRIQLLAYLLMLSERMDGSSSAKDVKEGKIIYLDSDKVVNITLNPFAEKEIKELVSKTNAMLNSGKLPDFCGNENKCSACGLKENCYDEVFLKERLEALPKAR
ncbi:CRISPR-associated protein Cas4 [Candidatus Woesearchaeota archaeon CG10_big_fil_rev_8_21_14_0_10_44_13]|nr:MAG: CRISPR-associated protein Cas4 [Candidatus Woesearchaeota archaeon CG10_big_fil_rev_8_21_14_0_10_44_13]